MSMIDGQLFYICFNFRSVKKRQGAIYVQVEPIIRVGGSRSGRDLPLDSIRCQTVLSKLLGPLSTWEKKLLVAKNSGYNLIHFTPIQVSLLRTFLGNCDLYFCSKELGASRSCYSLSDQLKVNQGFAENKKVTFDDIERVVKKMRDEWGVASICDIVLNHTANESEWLLSHPESTYSCHTMPHLRPPFLLDAVFARITTDAAEGKLETVGVPKIVETEDHLQALRHQLNTVYLQRANLSQFYQCDIEAYITKLSDKVGACFVPPQILISNCLSRSATETSPQPRRRSSLKSFSSSKTRSTGGWAARLTSIWRSPSTTSTVPTVSTKTRAAAAASKRSAPGWTS